MQSPVEATSCRVAMVCSNDSTIVGEDVAVFAVACVVERDAGGGGVFIGVVGVGWRKVVVTGEWRVPVLGWLQGLAVRGMLACLYGRRSRWEKMMSRFLGRLTMVLELAIEDLGQDLLIARVNESR